MRTSFESDLSAVVSVEGLAPATRYEYTVEVDGTPVALPAEAGLTTASPEQARTGMRVAFGGDFHRWGFARTPLFDRILSRKPAAMILVGDIAAQDRFTHLGRDQMEWLREQLLLCRGPFVILSCGTMWSDHVSDGKDSWGKFSPGDREDLFALLDGHRAGRVLLVSGDRHGACGYRIPRPGGRDLYEFNVGSLGGIGGDRAPASQAPDADGNLLYRFGEGYAFGEFEFDTKADKPAVTFRLIAEDGRIVHERLLE